MPRSSKRKLANRANGAKAKAARAMLGVSRRKVTGFLPAIRSKDRLERLLHQHTKLFPKAHRAVHRGSKVAVPPTVMCDMAVQTAATLQLQPSTCDAAIQAVSKEEEAKDQLIRNLRCILFDSFASNTDERKILVARLSAGIHQSIASKLLGVSPKMIQRGNASVAANPERQLGQAQPKQNRQRMSAERHNIASHVLDTIAPVQSGRQWRVVRCTEDHLYKEYVAYINSNFRGQAPVSKTYFIEHVLDKKHNCVHHENAPDFCQQCQRRTVLRAKKTTSIPLTAEEEAELDSAEQHLLLAKTQWNVYHDVMENLLKQPGLRLIVQDFNKQETASLETQVLSIVVYEATTGTINRHYFHYLLPTNVSNDVTAVIACHRLFFKEPLIKYATELSIWNDGGPKHFKLTANLAHMWALANASETRTKITQHFFVSYHGSGPADAAAQHLKQAILDETRNVYWLGESLPVIVSKLTDIMDPNTTKCFQVDMAGQPQKILVETAAGLKKMHKFTFHPNWTVCGWVHSAAQAPSIMWQLTLLPASGPVL